MIKVLIVEDYKIIRVGLRSLLKKDEQIEVVGEAEDGESGVALANDLNPDLVLLDLGLPKMDGIEVTRHIKALNSNIKIVILTSHENDEEVVEALRAGANAYCLKDIPSPRLLEIIKAVNEGAAWLDPAIAKVAFSIFNRMDSLYTRPSSQGLKSAVLLSEREYAVLRLLVDGKSNLEIAENLFLSVHTVKAHVGNILQKLSVDDRVKAAVKAIKEGIV